MKKAVVKPIKEELEQLYLTEKMSTIKIGKMLGVNYTSIVRWLKEYGIQIRTLSEAKLTETLKPPKEVLEEMYIEKKINAKEIAEKLGVTGATVGVWLREYEIPVRTRSETKLMRTLKPKKEILEQMYLEESMSAYEIAEKIGVGGDTICVWLRSYKIPMRTLSEAQSGKCTGEINGNWIFDRTKLKSKILYCNLWNENLRERSRDFFFRICQNCGKTEEEQKAVQKAKGKRQFRLTVHHVHYNKDTCCDKSEWLFLPICLSCHGIIRKDDPHYEYVFTREIREKYNNVCFFPKVMVDPEERKTYRRKVMNNIPNQSNKRSIKKNKSIEFTEKLIR